ncbi:3-deoxy-manno-octulosonate cytidylyltransferase [Candidatus Neomarinimicrobiota bacterium]
MTVIGIIPARYDSTRFPGKVLVPIHGYPMVHHVYRRSLACTQLDDLIIATDSELVAETCTNLGDKVVLTGSEHTSGTDRVAEVARNMEVDIFVNIQGDEPLLDPEVIDQLVLLMLSESHLLMGTVGSRALAPDEVANPNIVKVIERDGLAAGFYRTLPIDRPEGEVLKHVGFYAYRARFLQEFSNHPPSPLEREHHLEQLRALSMGAAVGVLKTDYCSLAVDTPEGLKRVMSAWHE